MDIEDVEFVDQGTSCINCLLLSNTPTHQCLSSICLKTNVSSVALLCLPPSPLPHVLKVCSRFCMGPVNECKLNS